MSPRELFVTYLMAFIGLAYRWGGNGILGIDCSGLVCEGLKAVGLISADANAKMLLHLFSAKKVSAPDEGCLAFFGKESEITHVAVCIGNGLMIEAGGGGRAVDTEAKAEALGAMVRIRPISNRKDLVCFVDPF